MNINFDIIKISPRTSRTYPEIDYSILVFKVDMPKRVDIENSNELWIFFKTIIDGGSLKIMVNMDKLEYIDSSGIGILINSAKLLRTGKGDLIFFNVSQDVKKIFSIVKLEKFIKIFNMESEAINHFRYI